MKKNQIFFTKWIGILIISISLISCNKFIQVDPPETKAELSKIFADDQTAISAVAGLYAQITASLNFCNGTITIFGSLSADDMVNVSPNNTYDYFSNNALLSNNSTIQNSFWTNAYKNIYQVNTILEGLSASQTLSPSVKEQLRGESLYTRAFHYFYLVNLFGAVPYQTVSDYKVNAVMPRIAVDQIYEQITADLIEAGSLLKGKNTDNLRPGKDAVTALLARVYLYRKNWSKAAELASEVIGSGKYLLETPANTFLMGSKETIYQFYRQRNNTAEAGYLLPSSATARPLFKVRDNLISAFESGDSRKTNWLNSNTVSGTIYFFPYKYKTRAQTPITEYLIVQRLAELYLIRAEARANLNDLKGAINDVDQIRSRAALKKLEEIDPEISKDRLLIAIAKENQVEFFAEWAHRWLDLKRLGKADEVMTVIKGSNWKPTAKLYPIPFAETQLNVFLTQNEGYDN